MTTKIDELVKLAESLPKDCVALTQDLCDELFGSKAIRASALMLNEGEWIFTNAQITEACVYSSTMQAGKWGKTTNIIYFNNRPMALVEYNGRWVEEVSSCWTIDKEVVEECYRYLRSLYEEPVLNMAKQLTCDDVTVLYDGKLINPDSFPFIEDK